MLLSSLLSSARTPNLTHTHNPQPGTMQAISSPKAPPYTAMLLSCRGLLQGAADGWRARQEWVRPDGSLDLDFLQANFGDARVTATDTARWVRVDYCLGWLVHWYTLYAVTVCNVERGLEKVVAAVAQFKNLLSLLLRAAAAAAAAWSALGECLWVQGA